jgi:hypothetical protein
MKKVRWVSATAGAALVAATFALPGAGVAYASDNGNTTGNGNISVLSGNTITAPISAPVNLCGISLAVAGFSNAGCEGGSSSTISHVGDDNHNGNVTGNRNISLGSGNTVTAPISAPVNVCGVSGAVGGFSNSGCEGGSRSVISGVGGHNDNGNVTGNFNIPVVSGNTVTAPVSAPVNVCGISLALLGFSNAACKGGATSVISGVGGHDHNGNVTGNRNIPVVSGNTITAPVSVPVNVCGNAAAAGGFANANCKGGSTSCIGDDCKQHGCQGPECHECHGPQCHECQGPECHQCQGPECHQCHGPQCKPCQGPQCKPCQGPQCKPCQGNNCHCMGQGCHPCQHKCTPPPGCTTNCGGTPGCTSNCGGTPPGNHPGTTTTVSTGTSPAGLPTTGADLLLLGVAALGSIGVGAGAVAVARRRRNGEN